MLNTKSIDARQTAIPVLLVSGFMFVVAGALKFVVGEESPISDFPVWMSIALFAVALVLIAIAVLNMLHVRQFLAGAAAAAQNATGADSGDVPEPAN